MEESRSKPINCMPLPAAIPPEIGERQAPCSASVFDIVGVLVCFECEERIQRFSNEEEKGTLSVKRGTRLDFMQMALAERSSTKGALESASLPRNGTQAWKHKSAKSLMRTNSTRCKK